MTSPSIRPTFLPFALPELGPEEIDAVSSVISSGWITTGQVTRDFEAAFKQVIGARHAIAVNSATAAMHLALEAIGIRPGDEVITTPYTFAATAEVVRYFDAKPVLVDIDPKTLNIDPSQITEKITERTKAIIPVDIAGFPADYDPIMAIAEKANIRVIEDAAHAFPCKYKGRMIGSLADFTCFSFYATKTITTGEGGMICTENDAWADRCRIMALHGISRDAWKRYLKEGSWYYEIIAPGYKYNLTDMASSIGLVQLRKAETMRLRRALISKRYSDAFRGLPELEVPTDGDGHQHSWHLYTLRLNAETLRINRDAFIEELKKRNIGASVHFIPLHLHPYYRERYGYSPEDFPNAFREFKREISLPIFSKMTDDDVEYVRDCVVDIVGSNRV